MVRLSFASFSFVTPASFSWRESPEISMVESSTFTKRSSPARPRPAPAVSSPERANTTKTKASVPITSEPLLFVQTKEVSALLVPFSQNTASEAASIPTAMSLERTSGLAAWTT